MKKKMIIILIICLILGIIYIIYNSITSGDNVLKFNNKISKLEDSIIQSG